MDDTFLSACHISPSWPLRGPESASAVCEQMPLKSLETALTASVPESTYEWDVVFTVYHISISDLSLFV